MTAADRRQALREGLIAAAGQAIAAEGLAGLRARDLARDVGCALGAIYNVFADLDDLVLAVNARTLAVLERDLARARPPGDPQGAEAAIAALEALALAYADFAAANMLRWRAVFDHRLPRGRSVPDWYVSEQARLFDYVAAPCGRCSRALSRRNARCSRAPCSPPCTAWSCSGSRRSCRRCRARCCAGRSRPSSPPWRAACATRAERRSATRNATGPWGRWRRRNRRLARYCCAVRGGSAGFCVACWVAGGSALAVAGGPPGSTTTRVPTCTRP